MFFASDDDTINASLQKFKTTIDIIILHPWLLIIHGSPEGHSNGQKVSFSVALDK